MRQTPVITGAALAWQRRRVGMSQVGLAARLGHPTPATVRDWEAGKRAIPRSASAAIAAAIVAARLDQARYDQRSH